MKKPEVINGMTFEMAQTMVNGTKYKAVNNFKKFATAEFDYDDMVSEADIAILQAWREWDPSKTKFNTHATNMINWLMYRALENHNPVFRMNRKTKMNLNNRGESFKTLAVKKLTADAEFNAMHGLDGEKEFTREHFNSYVYFVTSKTFGISVKSQSEIHTPDGDSIDIMDTIADNSAEEVLREAEFNADLAKMDEKVQTVYKAIAEGATMKEALEAAGTNRTALKKLYAKGTKKIEEMA